MTHVGNWKPPCLQNSVSRSLSESNWLYLFSYFCCLVNNCWVSYFWSLQGKPPQIWKGEREAKALGATDFQKSNIFRKCGKKMEQVEQGISPKVGVRTPGLQSLSPVLTLEKGRFPCKAASLPRSSLLWELNAFDKKPELFWNTFL